LWRAGLRDRAAAAAFFSLLTVAWYFLIHASPVGLAFGYLVWLLVRLFVPSAGFSAFAAVKAAGNETVMGAAVVFPVSWRPMATNYVVVEDFCVAASFVFLVAVFLWLAGCPRRRILLSSLAVFVVNLVRAVGTAVYAGLMDGVLPAGGGAEAGYVLIFDSGHRAAFSRSTG
jgi:hypothetical protein